jgi:hypothetical protein
VGGGSVEEGKGVWGGGGEGSVRRGGGWGELAGVSEWGDRFGMVDWIFLVYPQSNMNHSYYSMSVSRNVKPDYNLNLT